MIAPNDDPGPMKYWNKQDGFEELYRDKPLMQAVRNRMYKILDTGNDAAAAKVINCLFRYDISKRAEPASARIIPGDQNSRLTFDQARAMLQHITGQQPTEVPRDPDPASFHDDSPPPGEAPLPDSDF